MHENAFNIRIESSLFFNISSNTDGGGLCINKTNFKVLIFSSCFNRCSSTNYGGGAFINTTYAKCSHSIFFNNIALCYTAIGIITNNSTSTLLSISKNSIKTDSTKIQGWTFALTCQEANSHSMNSSNNIANHISSYHSYTGGNTYYRFIQAYNDISLLNYVMIQATYTGHSEYSYSNFQNCSLKGDIKLENIRAAQGATMLLEFCYGMNLKSEANYFSSDVESIIDVLIAIQEMQLLIQQPFALSITTSHLSHLRSLPVIVANSFQIKLNISQIIKH